MLLIIGLPIAGVVTPFFRLPKDYSPVPESVRLTDIVNEPAEMHDLIKDGNAKWVSNKYNEPEWAICYIHGFTASPMELQPIVSVLAQQLRANFFITRLSGHGLKDPSPMGKVKAQDWVDDAKECLAAAQRMGKKTLLMGTSFGGTLSTLVTLNAVEPPTALILISPNFGIQNKASFLLAGVMAWPLTKIMFGDHRVFEPEVPGQSDFWSTKHPSIALKPFMQLTLDAYYADPIKIHTPTLVAYSPQDEVLDVKNIENFYAKISATKKNMVTEKEWDRHVLAGNIMNPKGNKALYYHILDFIKPL